MTKAELQKEHEQIRLRRQRRKQADEKDAKRLQELDKLIDKENLRELVGVENAVKVRTRRLEGSEDSWVNEARGTIVKIKRTRATVRWNMTPPNGYDGQWEWSIADLLPVDDNRQGFMLQF